jgi:putative GTP pyrophosphokinase
MANPPKRTVSNSAADRAGDRFRRWAAMTGEEQRAALEDPELAEAIRTIIAYRAMHARPMTSVTMGIRSMVTTVRRDDSIRPAQRFKREDRILTKLLRYPRMRLSQMEDIGGCRVVLPSIDEVYRVLDRIRHNWSDAIESDYIGNPKPDGYRGIHVVKKRDGRLVEVQLRTIAQHVWASQVEISSPRVRFNLKDGEGPADLREYFKQASDRLARHDRGEPEEAAAEAAFATLRQRVLPYFQEPNKV